MNTFAIIHNTLADGYNSTSKQKAMRCPVPSAKAFMQALSANKRRDELVDKCRMALERVEEALGENLQFLTDRMDLSIRQKDEVVIRKLGQLNTAWESVVFALNAVKKEC